MNPLERIKKDKCEFCEGTMEQRTIRARFHYKKNTIYVDHVPAWVCNHCGEQYFDPSVYKRMEEIAQNREKIEKKITFPLAEYEAVG